MNTLPRCGSFVRLPLAALGLFTALSLAATTQVVVPNNLANTEGNSSSTDLFNTQARQMTQVYSASEFGIPAGSSGLVTSVSFRLDGNTAQSFSGFWPFIGITLSTTPHSPDSLSPIVVNNGGADSVSVFSSSLFVRATNIIGSPRFFEVQMPFTTPFWYDPAKGNLSMYISSPFGGPANLVLDAQDSVGDGVGRVYGPDGQVSGTVDSLGMVTQFGMTIVPEPTPFLLLTLGVGTLFLFRRRTIRSK